jgi:cell division cycle 14
MPRTSGGLWGQLDLERYEHFDDPLNADLNEVVPGELVVFRGPRDLPGGRAYLDGVGRRQFSPGYLAEVLAEVGVSTVVRACEAEYDAGAFAARGLAHHDLPFPDGAPPPPRVAAAFLAAVDSAAAGGGAVGVHCRGGPGRAGTLAGLALVARHGFGGREAMGWLRLVRPGSVVGLQVEYLCGAAASGRRSLTPPPVRSNFPPSAERKGKKEGVRPHFPGSVSGSGKASAMGGVGCGR